MNPAIFPAMKMLPLAATAALLASAVHLQAATPGFQQNVNLLLTQTTVGTPSTVTSGGILTYKQNVITQKISNKELIGMVNNNFKPLAGGVAGWSVVLIKNLNGGNVGYFLIKDGEAPVSLSGILDVQIESFSHAYTLNGKFDNNVNSPGTDGDSEKFLYHGIATISLKTNNSGYQLSGQGVFREAISKKGVGSDYLMIADQIGIDSFSAKYFSDTPSYGITNYGTVQGKISTSNFKKIDDITSFVP